jgi:hypothetical protein
MLGFE